MLYSKIQYPASFSVLKPEVRVKAIDIANSLLEEGLSQKVAEEVARANCMEMVKSSAMPSSAHIADSTIHVIPHPDGWAIVSQDLKKFYAVYHSKKESVLYARSYAKSVKFKVFIHSEQGFIEDSENFMVNRPSVLSKNRLSVKREFSN